MVREHGQGSWRDTHLVHVDLEIGGSCFFTELPAGKILLGLPLNLAHTDNMLTRANCLLLLAYPHKVHVCYMQLGHLDVRHP